MSQQVKELFKTHLLKEEEEVFRDRSLPEPSESDFPENTEGDFEAGLEVGSDPAEFDTDDLGFDPEQIREDNFAAVYQKVDKIDEMIKDLVDPKVEGNLTNLLSQHDRADSVGNGVIHKLEKPIQKASIALSEVKIILDQIASMEATLKRRIEALESK